MSDERWVPLEWAAEWFRSVAARPGGMDTGAAFRAIVAELDRLQAIEIRAREITQLRDDPDVCTPGPRYNEAIDRLRRALAARERRRPEPCTPGHCDRCVPGRDGEHISVLHLGQRPCEHV